MKRTLATLLIAISAPSLVAAQELSGGVTLGYGSHDLDDLDLGLSTTSLDGRLDLGFENGITLGVEAGYIDIGIDDISTDADGRFIGLDLGYRFSNGASVGAYFEQLTLGVDGLPIDLTLETVGLNAGYSMAGLDIEGFIGETTTSPDIGLILDADVRNIGLTAKYSGLANLDLGAAFVRATIDSSGDDVDIDLVGLAAAYDVNAEFSVFGGVSRTSLDEADLDITTFGLGVGYDLARWTRTSTVVSLELARTDLSAFGDSTDLDTIRLGLTFPLGGQGSEAPLNSVADSIFNARRGA
ncbi:MAG: hypothetical protein B7Z31_14715, partial [Rhodobacterales bacterium 12-65-15]